MSNAREDVKRLSNLLMVGNGGALLVIFNARAKDAMQAVSPGVVALQQVAWLFALGLIAAFLMYWYAYRYDLHDGAPLKIGMTKEQAATAQAARLNATGSCFAAAGALFVLGLLIAINMLGPSASGPPAQAEAAPATVAEDVVAPDVPPTTDVQVPAPTEPTPTEATAPTP